MPKRTSVRPNEAAPRQTHAAAQPTAARQHPLVNLQSIIGNQAVQRLLIQREDSGKKESMQDKAERYLRDHLARQDKLITRAFEAMEGALLPGESEYKLRMIRHVKMIHATSGILSLSMLDLLYKAIMPVQIADYMERLFYYLRQDVKYKAEMVEGLNDPWEWYNKHMDRLLRR